MESLDDEPRSGTVTTSQADDQGQDLLEGLLRYGRGRPLSRGEVLIQQGAPTDGVYYLTSGELGVYHEDEGARYLLSRIAPGTLVGELGATTGWARTATVLAEQDSEVIFVPEAEFRQALHDIPGLAATIIHLMAGRLTDADIARVNLGRSYQWAKTRAETLDSEKGRLEELLRLREELADMIVHDLRNPLGVILGGLSLLQLACREDQSEYAASVVGTMERAAERMQRLVETLLDIAQLEEKGIPLQRTPLNLGKLVRETVAEELSLAEVSGVALESQVPMDLAPVLADRDMLQRVLINLLDNGLKFTPRGGRVWVTAEPRGEDLRVEVVDNGPGIPPRERERIFEKFTQVRGREGTRRGSGLGLAFCRMVMEAHGGRIWVEEGPDGVGSRFVLTLPLAGT